MLRPTRPEDAEAACALVQAGFDTFARFSPGWTAPDETGPESVALAVARFEDPTAFSRVEEVWGDGLARRLHSRAVRAMVERGVRTARLNTPAGQARSRAFYEREGWRPRLAPVVDEHMHLALVEYGLALP